MAIDFALFPTPDAARLTAFRLGSEIFRFVVVFLRLLPPDLRADDFRADALRAMDLRADDLRADDARFGVLFLEARLGAFFFIVVERRALFRPPERPPAFLPPFEPRLDDFLAAAML